MGKVIKFTCKQCGNVIHIPAPEKAGIYSVTCPNCKKQQRIKFDPQPAVQPIAPIMQQQMPVSPAPQPNDAQHRPTVKWGNAVNKPQLPKVAPSIPTPSAPMPQTKSQIAKLVCGSDKFALKLGDNIVGRQDMQKPSDIQLSGDMTMSRRSVCITVTALGLDYTYELKILNAVNPIEINGRVLSNQAIAKLTLGTTIKMGETILRLEQ